MAIIGLDIGTSGTKGLAFGRDWRLLAESRRAYAPVRGEDGRSWLDPSKVITLAGEVLADCAARCGERIDALSFSALGEAMFPVDAGGKPLAPAEISSSAGHGSRRHLWAQAMDLAELRLRTGLPYRDWWAANRIAVIGQRHPSCSVLTFEEAMMAACGVVPRVARSLAARSLLLESDADAWSPALAAIAAVDLAALSPIADPGARVGVVSRATEIPGLPPGTLVAAAGHDQYCAAIGSGASRSEPMWASGTVDAVIFLAREKDAFGPAAPSYRADRSRWMSPFPNLNGGGAVAFVATLLGIDDLEGALGDLAFPERLLVVPSFGMTGAPDFDTEVAGTLAGLRYGDDRNAVLRATVEGVVFETMHALEASGVAVSSITSATLTGGGSRSRAWCQIKADALGVPVVLRRWPEASCVGAAMFAAEALTGSSPDVERANPVVECFHPEPRRSERLRERFGRYQRARARFARPSGEGTDA